ncbi:MAG TPA: hypothetical protein VKY26_11545 [Actinomycetota bacterium]|nr:hypothetical protein [Actinomycetota bacterium]
MTTPADRPDDPLARVRAMAEELASRGDPARLLRDADPDRARERDEQQRRLRGGFGWLARELDPEQLEAEIEARRARARAKYGTDSDLRIPAAGGGEG